MDNTNVLLLNTHFTPSDRSQKIYIAKEKLCQGDKVVLISTQLIEAGVDIDFLYFTGILLPFQVLYNLLVVAIEMGRMQKRESCCC